MQHSVSLNIARPQIIALQKDTQALKIMFPATQNDKAKNARKKPKTKQTCNSTFHNILPFHKLCLYKTATKHKKIMFLATQND